MKLIRTLIASTCLLLLCQLSQAQLSYKPTDKWPYLFETFQPATIHQYNGGDIKAEANVCIDDGSLHYIDGGVIKQYTGQSIKDVEFGDKDYIFVRNAFMEILAGEDGSYVLKETLVDNTASDGVDIGFGIVSNTHAATSVDMTASSGLGTALLHTKVAEAIQNAEYGSPLNTVEKVFFYTNGKVIPATKKDFTDSVGKDVATSFLKANKIKWNNPEDLKTALDCLKANLAK